jgi:hypothetical protein
MDESLRPLLPDLHELLIAQVGKADRVILGISDEAWYHWQSQAVFSVYDHGNFVVHESSSLRLLLFHL